MFSLLIKVFVFTHLEKFTKLNKRFVHIRYVAYYDAVQITYQKNNHTVEGC